MSATGFDTCNPDSRFSGIQHLTSGLASIFRHAPKIIAHFCRSVKWLEPLSLGRTVWIAIADQVIQLSGIPRIPSTPNYV